MPRCRTCQCRISVGQYCTACYNEARAQRARRAQRDEPLTTLTFNTTGQIGYSTLSVVESYISQRVPVCVEMDLDTWQDLISLNIANVRALSSLFGTDIVIGIEEGLRLKDRHGNILVRVVGYGHLVTQYVCPICEQDTDHPYMCSCGRRRSGVWLCGCGGSNKACPSCRGKGYFAQNPICCTVCLGYGTLDPPDHGRIECRTCVGMGSLPNAPTREETNLSYVNLVRDGLYSLPSGLFGVHGGKITSVDFMAQSASSDSLVNILTYLTQHHRPGGIYMSAAIYRTLPRGSDLLHSSATGVPIYSNLLENEVHFTTTEGEVLCVIRNIAVTRTKVWSSNSIWYTYVEENHSLMHFECSDCRVEQDGNRVNMCWECFAVICPDCWDRHSDRVRHAKTIAPVSPATGGSSSRRIRVRD